MEKTHPVWAFLLKAKGLPSEVKHLSNLGGNKSTEISLVVVSECGIEDYF